LLFERCAIRLWLILAVVVVAVDFLLIENTAATGMLRQSISRNLLENLALVAVGGMRRTIIIVVSRVSSLVVIAAIVQVIIGDLSN